MKKTYYLIEQKSITAAEKEYFPRIAEVILEVSDTERRISKDRDHKAGLVGDTLSFKLPPLVAPAPLVPLGPNRFRNGTPCRVICNDRKHGQSGYAEVVILEPNDDGSERMGYRNRDGSVSSAEERPEDLIGHFPPKPREVWIWENSDGLLPGPVTPIAQSGSEWKRFREVIE